MSLRSSYRASVSAIFTGAMFCMISGCDYLPLGFTPLSDVANKPAQFQGQVIKVRGTVQDNLQFSFFGVRYYALEENGSQIIVFTQFDVPALGTKIAIRARLSSIAVISGESIGTHLEEVERLTVFGN